MGEGFFSAFPGYKDQSALSFLKGRSSRFLHFYAVCSIMSRQEFSCILRVFGSGLFSFGFIRLLDFLIYLVITVNTCLFVVKIFSLFISRYFVSGVCFTHCIRHFKLGVLGLWEFLWRAGSCIFLRV